MQNNILRTTVSIAVLLALFVVMLGAYTRLTDAGLGCPDWPGCYGRMVLPSVDKSLQDAQSTFPHIPIESKKAWTEMAHRYAAGTLAIMIFFIGLYVLRKKYRDEKMPWHIPLLLAFLVVFQAALGMWTVTLKLLPVVVMSHLLGGMLIVALLSRFRFQISSYKGQNSSQWRFWLILGGVIVFVQIALGGWVSSNYAGVSCIGFPQCNGLWLPELHFAKGFNLFSPVGANYQGGVLDNDVRVSIQWVHRLGAAVTASYLLILAALILIKSSSRCLKIASLFLIMWVLLQCCLGIFNVIYLLPIRVAVAHNGIAALLLATIFSMLHFTKKGLHDVN